MCTENSDSQTESKIPACVLGCSCRRTRLETTRRLCSTSVVEMTNAGLRSTERCCETWDVTIDPDMLIPSDFCLLLIELL